SADAPIASPIGMSIIPSGAIRPRLTSEADPAARRTTPSRAVPIVPSGVSSPTGLMNTLASGQSAPFASPHEAGGSRRNAKSHQVHRNARDFGAIIRSENRTHPTAAAAQNAASPSRAPSRAHSRRRAAPAPSAIATPPSTNAAGCEHHAA